MKRYCSICGRVMYENKEKRCRCYRRMWVTKEKYAQIKQLNDRTARRINDNQVDAG